MIGLRHLIFMFALFFAVPVMAQESVTVANQIDRHVEYNNLDRELRKIGDELHPIKGDLRDFRESIQAMKELLLELEGTEYGTGPVRELISLLISLVRALTVLVGVVAVVQLINVFK